MSQDEKLVDVVSNAAQDIGSFIRSQREAENIPGVRRVKRIATAVTVDSREKG